MPGMKIRGPKKMLVRIGSVWLGMLRDVSDWFGTWSPTSNLEPEPPRERWGALGFWTREPVRTLVNIGAFTVWTREPLANIGQLLGAWKQKLLKHWGF